MRGYEYFVGVHVFLIFINTSKIQVVLLVYLVIMTKLETIVYKKLNCAATKSPTFMREPCGHIYRKPWRRKNKKKE